MRCFFAAFICLSLSFRWSFRTRCLKTLVGSNLQCCCAVWVRSCFLLPLKCRCRGRKKKLQITRVTTSLFKGKKKQMFVNLGLQNTSVSQTFSSCKSNLYVQKYSLYSSLYLFPPKYQISIFRADLWTYRWCMLTLPQLCQVFKSGPVNEQT